MQTTFNTAIKALAVAAAITFAGASQAAITVKEASVFEYANFDSNFFNTPFGTTVSPWTLSGDVQGLAFCIEPTVAVKPNAQYGVSKLSFAPSAAMIGLYETSYNKVFAGGSYNANNASAFQLALWEVLDNKDFTSGPLTMPLTGGDLDDNDKVAEIAYGMLSDALTYRGLGGSYAYTTYTDTGSQTLLGVSAVPEADSWAMLVVGLGLVGFAGRRKVRKSEKFI